MLTKLYVQMRAFMACRKGVTAIEYAIIAVAIAGIATAVFSSSGESGLVGALNAAMDNLKEQVSGATEATETPAETPTEG